MLWRRQAQLTADAVDDLLLQLYREFPRNVAVQHALPGLTIEQMQHVSVGLTRELINAPDQDALRRQVRQEFGERHGVVALRRVDPGLA